MFWLEVLNCGWPVGDRNQINEHINNNSRVDYLTSDDRDVSTDEIGMFLVGNTSKS